MGKQTIAAIILIAVGSLLFLDQIDVIYLSSSDFFVYASVIGGILLFINGMNREDRKGILGGTFFTLFGIYLWYVRSYYFYHDDELGFAAFFISLGIANLIYALFKRKGTSNFVFAGIFAFLGSGFLASYLGFYPSWRFFYHVEQYWPVALIVFGVIMLYKGFRKKEEITTAEQL